MERTRWSIVLVVLLSLGTGSLGGCSLRGTAESVRQDRSDQSPVMAVELVKSGGVTGIMETWEVSAQASPPSGMSPADARKVLAIASSDEFRSMTSEAVPSDYCCDQFHYEVTVTYADGSTAHRETADGLDQPAPSAEPARGVVAEPW